MAPTLDGNSESGAHLKSEIGGLICLGPLFRARAVGNLICQRGPGLLHTCVRCSELPSSIRTMEPDLPSTKIRIRTSPRRDRTTMKIPMTLTNHQGEKNDKKDQI